jgi:uncharacterized DUF497 family protein
LIDARFEWNAEKAATSLAKHGVSFEEAATVYGDPRRVEMYDLEHSIDEDRYIWIGFSHRMRLLMVVVYEQDDHEVYRIISARRATREEGLRYFAEA